MHWRRLIHTLEQIALDRRASDRDPPAALARLTWSHGRGTLRDLSREGLGVELDEPEGLRRGDRIQVTAVVEFLRFGPFDAEVVWVASGRAGLRWITRDSPEVRVLMALVTPPLESGPA